MGPRIGECESPRPGPRFPNSTGTITITGQPDPCAEWDAAVERFLCALGYLILLVLFKCLGRWWYEKGQLEGVRGCDSPVRVPGEAPFDYFKQLRHGAGVFAADGQREERRQRRLGRRGDVVVSFFGIWSSSKVAGEEVSVDQLPARQDRLNHASYTPDTESNLGRSSKRADHGAEQEVIVATREDQPAHAA